MKLFWIILLPLISAYQNTPDVRFISKVIKAKKCIKAQRLDIPKDFPARDAIYLMLGERCLEEKNTDNAVAYFKKALKTGVPTIRLRARVGLVVAYRMDKRCDKAKKLEDRLLKGRICRLLKAKLLYSRRFCPDVDKEKLNLDIFVNFPSTPFAKNTGLKEKDLSNELLLKRARALWDEREHEHAAKLLERLVQANYRVNKTAWLLARLYLYKLRNHPQRALELLDRVQNLNGISQSLLMARTKALKMMDRYDEAIQIYKQYLKLYPRGRFVKRAYYYFGWLPYDHNHFEEAIPFFDRFLRKFRHTSLRTYILWFKAWSQIKLHKYEEAKKTLKRMIPYGNNLVAGKAMYWLGVLDYRLNHYEDSKHWFEQLIDRYPLSYYSFLAHKRLHQWYNQPMPEWINANNFIKKIPVDWGLDVLKGRYRYIIRRTRALALLGLRAEAFAVFRRYERVILRRISLSRRPQFLYTVYGVTGQWGRLTKRARRLYRHYFGKVPTKKTLIYWALIYPRAERWYADNYAGLEGIPGLWPYAIMRQESHYNLSKVSVADAMGIMQMISQTARRVSKEIGIEYNPYTFFDPAINIRFCIHYLADLYRDFKGQILFASAAYNGGAPPIRRMMLAHKGEPFDEMVEDIAYNQSRNYARKVTEHLLRYLRIYAQPAERKRILQQIYPDQVDYNLNHQVDY